MFHKNSNSGFTILEMAMLVLIGGAILAAMGAALLATVKQNRIEITEYRLQRIQEALWDYLAANRNYPCPAGRTLLPNDANYAKCNGTIGTVLSGGVVRIGIVPTRTLNLTDEFIADSWGRKFTYAVTQTLTDPATYNATGGAVTIQGITTAAHYVVVSHGQSGMGGYVLGGNSVFTACSSTYGRDSENCNDDSIFRIDLVNNDSNLTNFYDDYVHYQAQDKTVPIPAGAVMPFNQTTCPEGWIAYTRAEGRFVVGARATANTPRIPALRNAGGTLNFTATAGFMHPNVIFDSDGIAPDLSYLGTSIEAANLLPYVALLYCEKLPNPYWKQ